MSEPIRRLPQDLAEPADLVSAIRQRRGGRLMNLDRLLLHSPVFAEGWGAFMGRVRGQSRLDPVLREIAMTVPAALLGAGYEVHHHGAVMRELGMSEAQLSAFSPERLEAPDAALFSAAERAVITLAREMTLHGRGSEAALSQVRRQLGADDGLLMELVTTIAAYTMVSLIVTTLEVRPETETGWD